MDIDPKTHGGRDSLIIPSGIRGNLGAFASNSSTTPTSGEKINSIYGSSQQLQLTRFDEDSSIRLVKVNL